MADMTLCMNAKQTLQNDLFKTDTPWDNHPLFFLKRPCIKKIFWKMRENLKKKHNRQQRLYIKLSQVKTALYQHIKIFKILIQYTCNIQNVCYAN